jgi:hypothetical protein
MKFKSIIFIALAVFTQTANAQTFGIKGGLNISTMSFESTELGSDHGSILGFHFGPVIDMQIKKNLYLNSGLFYSSKGEKFENLKEFGGTESKQLKLNCLEIPLYIEYKFPLESNIFFIQAGPYLGYTLSNKIDGKHGINFGEQGMNRFDFGVGGAVGFEFGPFVPSIAYQLGIADQFAYEGLEGKNRVLQISLAYMFGK